MLLEHFTEGMSTKEVIHLQQISASSENFWKLEGTLTFVQFYRSIPKIWLQIKRQFASIWSTKTTWVQYQPCRGSYFNLLRTQWSFHQRKGIQKQKKINSTVTIFPGLEKIHKTVAEFQGWVQSPLRTFQPHWLFLGPEYQQNPVPEISQRYSIFSPQM